MGLNTSYFPTKNINNLKPKQSQKHKEIKVKNYPTEALSGLLVRH